MPSYELGEHVEKLARELGVVIIPPWVGSLAEAATEFPAGAAGHMELEGSGEGFDVIWVSEEPVTAEAYLVALHELGHHAVEGDSLYAREADAWSWAEFHSLIPITPNLRAFIERRLESYR